LPVSAPTIVLAAAGPHDATGPAMEALMRGLRRLGLTARRFGIGPCPARPGRVALDAWAMRLDTLAALLDAAGDGADILVGEACRPLFDGAADGTGAAADLAALFGLPIVLLVDAAAAPSTAALIEGLLRHREDVDVAAVILGRVAGPEHARLLLAACDARFATPILGCIEEGQSEPELDLTRLLRLARHPSVTLLGAGTGPLPPLGQRIAVAVGDGFAAPEATLAGWRRQGAEIVPFAGLADEPPPAGADAVYLPPGDLAPHLGRLAGCHRLAAGLRHASRRGAFVYGEGSGYMALCRSVTDGGGPAQPMPGLLPAEVALAETPPWPVYRRLALLADSPLGPSGARFRGHEPSAATERIEGGAAFAVAEAVGSIGCRVGNVAGSLVQLVDAAAP
jgi:cobyrinic acid a,c-diamide synthase